MFIFYKLNNFITNYLLVLLLMFQQRIFIAKFDSQLLISSTNKILLSFYKKLIKIVDVLGKKNYAKISSFLIITN